MNNKSALTSTVKPSLSLRDISNSKEALVISSVIRFAG